MPWQAFMFEVLAQAVPRINRERTLDAMHERFVTGEPELWQGVVTACVVLGMLLGSVWLMYRWQHRRRHPASTQPMSFYRRILGKLGLSMLDRWFLWRLARFTGLEHPTAMLISPRMYDSAVQRYCASRGPMFSRAGSAGSFAAIRRKLFSGEGE
jgi:hypothetical protein